MTATPSISVTGVTQTTASLSWNYSGKLSTEVLMSATISGPGGVSSSAYSGTATATGLSAGTSYTWTYDLQLYDTRFGSADYWIVTRTVTATTTAATLPVWTDSSIGSSAQYNVSFSNGVAATGATSYSVASGALPNGLTLNTSTGAITGTPNTVGTFTGTLRATNAGGSITTSFNIVIWSTVTWTDSTIVENAQKSVAYSDDVSATGSPTPTYSFTGTLPPGLSLNTTNGNLTGTPTTAGTYSFTLRAAHSYSNVTSAKTFVVWEPVVWTDNNIVLTATSNTTYTDSVSASGSPAPGYYITSGSLPASLTLANTTGAIGNTITAAAGSYPFTITANNAYSNVTASFTMTISAAAPAETIRTIKVYNGSTWVPVAQTYWDGSAWVERTVKVYNGSGWEQIL